LSKAKQKARREAIALLAERFPQCFSIEGRREPLKIGTHADVLATLDGAIRPDELRRALASYTGNASYLRGVVPGACRRDLDGKPAGIVTPEEAADASAGHRCGHRAAARSANRARIIDNSRISGRTSGDATDAVKATLVARRSASGRTAASRDRGMTGRSEPCLSWFASSIAPGALPRRQGITHSTSARVGGRGIVAIFVAVHQSLVGPGCVKSRTGQECAECFTLLSVLSVGFQRC
jgi:sRNA-binding protein